MRGRVKMEAVMVGVVGVTVAVTFTGVVVVLVGVTTLVFTGVVTVVGLGAEVVTGDVEVMNELILLRVFAPTEPYPVVAGVPLVTIPYFFWKAWTAVVVRAP